MGAFDGARVGTTLALIPSGSSGEGMPVVGYSLGSSEGDVLGQREGVMLGDNEGSSVGESVSCVS